MSRNPQNRRLERAQLYSEELLIDLRSKKSGEYFKWFLASLLYGSHITESIAKHTYQQLEKHHLLSPRKIIKAGWSTLVDPIMREGGFVRYDGVKSTQLIRDCKKLVAEYGGKIERVHEQASGPRDLEERLMEFYGVGPVTANIFLRELRPHWAKADPEPLPTVLQAALDLGVDLGAYPRKSMRFVRVEAGLIRLRRHVHDLTAGESTGAHA